MASSPEYTRGCDCCCTTAAAASLDCLLSILHTLRMGSCFTIESTTTLPLRSPLTKKRMPSRTSSFNSTNDQLRTTPGRIFINGSTNIASLFTQQGKKGTNQDAMIVWENFGSRTDTVFCGVFDGHGPFGHMVARRVRDSLPLKLSAHWELNIKSDEVLREVSLNCNNTGGSFCSAEDATTTNLLLPHIDEEAATASVDVDETGNHPHVFRTLKDSFLKAFKVMDRELRMYANIDCFCSGTTAVTFVKQGQDLVIGNVGDSRAVLATRDENNSLTAVQLTVDLKPNLPAEAERIRKCKGRVFALQDEPEVSRVWLPHHDCPGLAMARAFGDFCLKEFGLISVPEISYRHLTDKDEFIVLASDGIWDVLSNTEVIDIVDSCPARSYAARTVVESAVRAWRSKYPTSKVDDCAVVCLFLDSNESVTASNIKSKENIIPLSELVEDAIRKDDRSSSRSGLNHSGIVRTNNEALEQENDDEASEDNDEDNGSDDEDMSAEVGKDWSALEGVSRVNTLVTLPRFVPGKEDEAAHVARARK